MSSAPGRTERVVHQDYIVRQRYSNALPPPPGAPKLLDIPLNPMALYTSPVFAERMHKAQPINIEADAFLGMPIDLVGMPGIFEGDESSIQAPLTTPALHPADRLLLRPLKSLGKPKNEVADISFLRRTQYTAEDRSRIEGSSSRAPTAVIKKKRADAAKEDPMTILRSVIKGFDIANPSSAYTGPDTATQIRGLTPKPQEIDAWRNPKHPTKPHLKLMDAYPLLPDLDAFTEDGQGGYAVLKFVGNPTAVNNRPDERLDAALLRSLQVDEAVINDYHQRLAAHKANPDRNPVPQMPTVNYELFLPTDENMTQAIKRKRDVADAGRDDPDLYTDIHDVEAGEKDCFKLINERACESGMQQTFADNPYQEVAIALYDGDDDKENQDGTMANGGSEGNQKPQKKQKAAYYYPIVAKTQVKPRRAAQLGPLGLARRVEETEEKIDVLAVQYRDQDEEDKEARADIVKALEAEEV